MITFLKGIGVDYDQLLKNNNLVNNISLMEIFKKIYYSWKTFKNFNDIKISYQNAQQRGKLSSLKNKLEIKDAVEVFKDISYIHPMSGMGKFALLQTFKHKAKLVTTLFLVCQHFYLTSATKIYCRFYHAALNKQTTEKAFVRTTELTNFVCENDTSLNCKDVFEKLTDSENG